MILATLNAVNYKFERIYQPDGCRLLLSYHPVATKDAPFLEL